MLVKDFMAEINNSMFALDINKVCYNLYNCIVLYTVLQNNMEIYIFSCDVCNAPINVNPEGI